MYLIGTFSKINKVTTKTLRHYDEIDLLKPEYVDRVTGYRYYTSNQLPKMHQILTLKQIGLSLGDIKEIIRQPAGLELYLKLKEQELLEVIQKQQLQLRQLQNFREMIKGEYEYMYTPIIKELPEVIVASMRQTVESYSDFFHLCPQVMGPEMNRLGCICREPAYCFNIYHDGEYKEKNIDVEICEAVTEMKEDTDLIKFKKIDKVDTAVSILHKGAYSSLGNAYSFIFKWIEDNNYVVVGHPRESYIDGIWNKENEEDWLTEIQVPIKIQA